MTGAFLDFRAGLRARTPRGHAAAPEVGSRVVAARGCGKAQDGGGTQGGPHAAAPGRRLRAAAGDAQVMARRA